MACCTSCSCCAGDGLLAAWACGGEGLLVLLVKVLRAMPRRPLLPAAAAAGACLAALFSLIVMEIVTTAAAVGLQMEAFMGLAMADRRAGGGGRRAVTVLTAGSCISCRKPRRTEVSAGALTEQATVVTTAAELGNWDLAIRLRLALMPAVDKHCPLYLKLRE